MWLWDHTRNSNYKLLTLFVSPTQSDGYTFPSTLCNCSFHTPPFEDFMSMKKAFNLIQKNRFTVCERFMESSFFQIKMAKCVMGIASFFFQVSQQRKLKRQKKFISHSDYGIPLHWPKLSSFISVM